MERIKLIFIGTADFGQPSLSALAEDKRFEILAVVSGMDKKIGRQQKIFATPIKNTAEKYGLPVQTPIKIDDIFDKLKNFQPDLIIVAAYAQLIPPAILALPKYGCINIHGSLLPKYRGAACVQAAIMNKDVETGITLIKMDEKLDTGPILARTKVAITGEDTSGTLSDKLAATAPALLIGTIFKFIKNEISPIPQEERSANYVKKIKKEDGRIDWGKSAADLYFFIRAMQPWPGAYSYLADNRILKIIAVRPEPIRASDHAIGALFVHAGQVAVQTGHDALLITKLQLAGKKEMSSENFLLGHHRSIGQTLK